MQTVVASNVDRLLSKDRVLYDDPVVFTTANVIYDEHFEQTVNAKTKQLSATSVKQKYNVTLESYQKPTHKPSEVYTWLH